MTMPARPRGRRPLYDGRASVTTSIVAPPALLAELDRRADAEGISRSQYCVRVLRRHVERTGRREPER